MDRRVLIGLFLAISIVSVMAWINLHQENKSFVSTPGTATTANVSAIVPQQLEIYPADPVRGSTAAAVTLVEFSDFECPYCAQEAPILASVVANNSGAVRLVWKDFPLPQHEQAVAAAEAAQCAGLQGKFWDYHDQLFQRQSELGAALYQQLAVQLGLDSSKFSQCMSQHQTRPLVEQNTAQGGALGVNGTPYLLVNGQVYTGSMAADDLNALIQQVHNSSAK